MTTSKPLGSFDSWSRISTRLQTGDPGGSYDVKIVERNGQREFQRFYVAPLCTKEFWKHCRRCGASDGTHCSTTVRGMLLIFSVLDANNQVMVLAFCYTGKEDRDGYDYFFSHLSVDFPGRTIVIGDGDKGMEFGMLAKWRTAELSRCVRHRLDNYHKANPSHKVLRPAWRRESKSARQ